MRQLSILSHKASSQVLVIWLMIIGMALRFINCQVIMPMKIQRSITGKRFHFSKSCSTLSPASLKMTSWSAACSHLPWISKMQHWLMQWVKTHRLESRKSFCLSAPLSLRKSVRRYSILQTYTYSRSMSRGSS